MGPLTIQDFVARNGITIDQLIEFNPAIGAALLEMKNEMEAHKAKLEAATHDATLKGIDQLIVSATPVERRVEPRWSIDQVAAEFGVTIQALIDINPDDPENAELRRAANARDATLLIQDGKPPMLEVGGESVQPVPKSAILSDEFLASLKTSLEILKVLNDRIASRLVLGKALPPGIPRLVTELSAIPRVSYVNEGFEWLSYETVLNNPQFRRTNQPLQIPLYCVEMQKVDVWLRQGIEPPLSDLLCKAFFPDIPVHGAPLVSKYSWPWKNRHFMRAETAIAVGRRHTTRHEHLVVLEPRVILPYNPYDNHAKSLALGTRRTDESMRQIVDDGDVHTWKLWKTASRSCVVELKPEKQIDDDWDPLLKPGPPALEEPFPWPWEKGNAVRKLVETRESFEEEIEKDDRFKLKNLQPHHVSLKTGVCFVGSKDQSWEALRGDGKDAIDGNWIVSCLRSDFVAMTDALIESRAISVKTNSPVKSLSVSTSSQPPLVTDRAADDR